VGISDDAFASAINRNRANMFKNLFMTAKIYRVAKSCNYNL
jgi:hypothetical protein